MLVREIGEEALVAQLRRLFAFESSSLITGIGDDAAVVASELGREEVWTTDLLLEGIHFRSGWQQPRELGYKALAVNLSDLAAMGATPRFVLLSLACAADTSVDFILEFCHGFFDLAARTGVAVIGGDTTGSAQGLVLSVTAVGSVAAGQALLRSGARVGDSILVSGYLGSAAGGLKLLEEQRPAELFPELRRAFLTPKARLGLGREARLAGVNSMTDLSDGLASDLRHICSESGVGARVALTELPVHPELVAACRSFDWDLEQLVLCGGEDYELLFTASASLAPQVAAGMSAASGVPVAIIGQIEPAERSLILVGTDGEERPFPAHGYNHFLDQ